MIRRALPFVQLPVLLTIALVIVLLTVPGRAELAVRIFVLLLAAYALAQLVAAVRRAFPAAGPSPFEGALRTREMRDDRLPELSKLEREVALGASTAFDLHYRLRPSVRRIAGELLAARRGVDLDGEPAAARRLLGDEAWELVRADREPPENRYAPGIEIATLATVVTSLEAL